MFLGAYALATEYDYLTSYGTTPSLDFFNNIFAPFASGQLSDAVGYYFDGTVGRLTDENIKQISSSNNLKRIDASNIKIMSGLFFKYTRI
jgi:hypothetical protein